MVTPELTFTPCRPWFKEPSRHSPQITSSKLTKLVRSITFMLDNQIISKCKFYKSFSLMLTSFLILQRLRHLHCNKFRSLNPVISSRFGCYVNLTTVPSYSLVRPQKMLPSQPKLTTSCPIIADVSSIIGAALKTCATFTSLVDLIALTSF